MYPDPINRNIKSPLHLQPFFTVVIVGLCLLFAYYSSFAWLFNIWSTDKEYSHGFLVPFVSLYFIWLRWPHLINISVRRELFAGSMVILFAVALLIVGRVGSVILFESISFLFMLPGLVLFLGGLELLKALAFPLLYLQFMVPWMVDILDRIHGPFQSISAIMGVKMLEILGYVVYQDGNFIHLPVGTLEVARECSGVGFLVSIIALGIPLVYLTQRRRAKGLAVILFGIAITILTNGFRVGMVGVMTSKYGIEMSHGPKHIFQGWLIAQVGFVALFIINWLFISKDDKQNGIILCDQWESTRNKVYMPNKGRADYLLGVLSALFILILGVYVQWFAVPTPVYLKSPLREIPLQIGSWTGTDTSWFPGYLYFPGTEQEISRTYSTPDGKTVYLYIGHFSQQSEGKSLINRFSRELRKNQKTIPTGLGSVKGPEFVNFSNPTIETERYFTIFWYRYPTREVTSRYSGKLQGIFDAIFSRRADGTVVVIGKKGVDSTDSSLQDQVELFEFAKGIYPELPAFKK